MILIKTIIRNFKSDKLFSSINLFGLVVGVTVSLVMYLWVIEQKNYDRFHRDSERIYRLIEVKKNTNGLKKSALTPAPLAQVTKDLFPQITESVNLYGEGELRSIKYQNRIIKVRSFLTDPAFFKIFSFPIVEGSKEMFFKEAFDVVISQKLAKKLFGKQVALGKYIEENTFGKYQYRVCGVIDIPKESHLDFDVLFPFASAQPIQKLVSNWTVIKTITYVKTAPNASFDNDQISSLSNLIHKHTNSKSKLYLQPLHDVYLHSDFEDHIQFKYGKIEYVHFFGIASLLILLISAFNYINLSIARTEKRHKELGIRMVLGASKRGIILHLLGEVLFLTICVQIVSCLLILLLQPIVSDWLGMNFHLQFNWFLLFYFVISALIISCLSTIYSSYCLFRKDLLQYLKNTTTKGTKRSIGKFVLPLQLIISFFFVICTLIILKQLDYIKNKDRGLTYENVISVDLLGYQYSFDILKSELLQNPNVYSVCASGIPPVNHQFSKADIKWAGMEEKEATFFNILCISSDYLETFDIHLTKGEKLSEGLRIDDYFDGKYSNNFHLLINETAEKIIGKDALGKWINTGNSTGSGYIRGVTKDFNLKPLTDVTPPVIMYYNPESFLKMNIKLNPKKKQETIQYIKQVSSKYRKTDIPFDYKFVEDLFQDTYQMEQMTSNLSTLFGVFTIFLSMFGFLSVLTYHLEKQKKNIAIRKVLGAESKHIIYMYLKSVAYFVLFAFVVSIACSLYFMQDWLSQYAYRLSISVDVFILGFVIVSMPISLVVVMLVRNTAKEDPVINLKYE